ncbi:translocation/assembly module TamB domain-containing protein [Oceaniglobus ichthyenteri]|uniref:translocation/assembly module TamB domain-containing protein n=1 Tax=Oceaniglobus ichthyenteri TaxID=2136177 RepID=UPI000D3D096C|nr:translocation/assembly module TamB domain-containing protein [Oceaniglobus ichthyenteri]
MRYLAPTLVSLSLLATPVIAQDDDGGGFLERLIEDNLSGAGREVNIRGFAGALSSKARLDELTIADENGIWLTLRDVELDWTRSALLLGRLEVTELTAEEIIIPRLPGSDPEAPTPEAKPFSLPDLPVSVQIEQIAAQRVDLGAALFGAAAVVSLNGSVSLANGEGAADISVDRIDGETGALTLQAAYANASEDLSIKLNLTEAENGITATLLDLPGRPSVHLDVDGTGPLSDFTAAIELDTDGERRLTGTVELTAQGEGDAQTRGFHAEIGGDIAPVFAPQYRPFFGPDIRLIASGATRPQGGFALAQLDLTAQALRLTGQVTIGANGLPELIDITGEISDASGQPVLLPVGEDARVDRVGVSVQFDADKGEDWTAKVTLDGVQNPGLNAQQVVLDGSGVIADDGAGAKTVTADLDFTASGLSAQDAAIAQALGDRATGAATLRWSSGAPIVLDTLQLNGNAFALDGSGQVAFADGTTATLDATLEAADLAAFSGLAGRNLGGAAKVALGLKTAPLDGAFDVELTGTTTDLTIDQEQADALLAGETNLTLRADRDETGTRLSTLTLKNPALDLAASGDLTSTLSNLRADIRLADAAVLDAKLSGAVDLTASAQKDGETWTYDVNGAGVGASIASTGTVTGLDEPSLRITTETDAEIADLSVFSNITGRDLGGSVALRLAGFTLADLSQADMSVTGETRGVKTGEARFDDLLVGRTDLAAQIQRNGETVTIQQFSLNGTGAGLRAEGAGQIEELTSDAPLISGMIEASINSLSRFSALAGRQLAGAVDATVTGSGRLDGSELDADLSLDGRSVLTGMADIDPLLAGLFTVNGTVSRIGETARIDALSLTAQSMGLTLTGSASAEDITSDAPLVTIDAAVVADTLAPLSGLAGRDMGGAVDLTVKGTARADLTVIDMAVNGKTRNLAVGQDNANRLLRGVTDLALDITRDGDVISLPSLSITNDQITLRADGQYGKGESAVKADVTIADLRDLEPRMRGQAKLNLFAEEVSDVWQVTLNGEAADAVLAATAEIREALGDNPEIDGRATLRAADLSRFAPLVGRPLSGGVQAEITGATRADFSTFNVTADIDANRVSIGQAEADKLLNGQTDLRLVARRNGAEQPIQVETFRLDAPTLTARANGSLLGSNANLTVSARLADIGAFVPGLNGPVTAEGRVSSTGNQLGVNLNGTGPGGITLRADGTVQQDFSRANLSLSGRAPLELANSFIEPRSVDGTLVFDVGVNGPLALSSVSGRINTQNARLVAPNLNLVLENINLTGDLTGGTIQLNVQANKQQGGQLTATGPITLSGGYNADLAIRAVGIVVEDPQLYRTLINGAVTVVGPLTGGARIAGTLDLVETEVRIPSTGLGATGPIPDGLVHVNEPAAVRATRARAGMIETATQSVAGTARPYPLDLTIRAERRIFVRGRGLDAELGGTLTLTGTSQNIIPAGQFELVRGRLDILGKRLNLDEGQISLQGDFTPYVRLVARTDTGDVVVLIVVEGSALAPNINFLSEPELPEEEVLARLLFGKSITSISPLQAAQLASAVATLAGKGGDGVISKLRESTGLDDLDITTDEDGNAGLRAGKYLSENLYTDVTVGATGEAEINLNLDITPNLTITGSADNAGDTSLGIYYQKDY